MEKLVEFTELAKKSSYVEELEKGIKFLETALKNEINEEMTRKTKQRLNTYFPDFREITESIYRTETEYVCLSVFCEKSHKVYIKYRGIEFHFEKEYCGDNYYSYKMEDINVSITVTVDCCVFLENIKNVYLREGGVIYSKNITKLLRYLSVPDGDDENDDDDEEEVHINHKMKDSILDYVRVLLDCGEVCEKYP